MRGFEMGTDFKATRAVIVTNASKKVQKIIREMEPLLAELSGDELGTLSIIIGMDGAIKRDAEKAEAMRPKLQLMKAAEAPFAEDPFAESLIDKYNPFTENTFEKDNPFEKGFGAAAGSFGSSCRAANPPPNPPGMDPDG